VSTSLRKRYGKRLREIRLNRGLTQEQLAEKANISLNFLNMVERGVRAPSFDNLDRLAKILQTPVFEFFRP
jgi:transcriptional regulator with XRE-family HTH domain